MLSFTTPNVQSSLVVKSASTIRPGDRLVVGRAASQILPRLYLSNLFTARDEEQLLSLGITHVISVIETLPKLPESIKVLHIPIADSMDTNILQYLDQTTAFITAALAENEHNKVLVHCLVGMSRSTTVVCAYLIATRSMAPSEAIGFVASKRSVASPNIGFRRQLETYAADFHRKQQKPQVGMMKVSFVGMTERFRIWKETIRVGASVREEDNRQKDKSPSES
ncbi:hypothetical protein AcW2_005171 [Taiwanofungus camphoratus]|nr:hypothetical protein AcW2_005171 [Antrodia cinnamomea]